MTHHAQQLVDLYRRFYRVVSNFELGTWDCIHPLRTASEVIIKADTAFHDREVLTDLVAGSVYKMMCQERNSSSRKNRSTLMTLPESEERIAIMEFAQYFVKEVFYGVFEGDIARYDGTQREILEDTCEFLYRRAQDQENKTEV